MTINESGVILSPIVEIGERLSELSARTGMEYLRLNRGINAVVNIDLNSVVRNIDFNIPKMQTYAVGAAFPTCGARSTKPISADDLPKTTS